MTARKPFSLFFPSILAAAAFLCAASMATEHFVSSDDDIRDLEQANAVQPGDTVTWLDGEYTGMGINFNFMGTADARITLRAETPGGVTLKGKSFVKFGGDYITVDGFRFYNGDDYNREIGSSVVQFRANNGNRHAHFCRLTNCAIIDMNSHEQDSDDDDEDGNTTELIFHSSKWVQIYGTNNRVDHCHFEQKKVRGALIIFEMVPQDGENGTPYESFNHRIDSNSFGPNPVGFVDNEFETIRAGTSDFANYNSNSVIENNYFYQCNGEIEVISNKSSNNIYRNNTLVECQGSIVMRHGDGCTIEGNIILADGASQSGGIRLNGQDHIVRNNYVSGTRGTGLRSALVLRRASGVSTGDTNGNYEQVRFAEITHNTFVDNTETFNLAESGSKNNSLVPTSNTIANNILYSNRGALTIDGSVPTNMTYSSNLAFGSALGMSDEGFTEADPQLVEASDGLSRPSGSSPALDNADAIYLTEVDIDGDPRSDPGDIGSDEVGLTFDTMAPLSADEVGPAWFDGGNGGSGSGYLANISTRAITGPGADGIVPGFVIAGAGSKKVLVRAIGPTLADFSISGALSDPILSLRDHSGTVIASNDDWETGSDTDELESTFDSVGAFSLPTGSKDAALVAELTPGAYTAKANSASEETGICLVEVYDAQQENQDLQLINISCRAEVGAGQSALVPGIAVRGDSPKTYLIRGVGPGLAEFEVSDFLADPHLELKLNGETIASNDNWSSSANAVEISNASREIAFELAVGSKDAAIIAELDPGIYNIVVTGANGSSGEALVEVYEIAAE